MSVTLLEVLSAAQARRLPLVGETIGYLVLALADQVLDAPRRVMAEDVIVNDGGVVSIRSGAACSSGEAEADLRSLLAQLLMVSRAGLGPLERAATRGHPGGTRGLVGALEAALVPMNRAAGRRALARLHRETERAREYGPIDRPAPRLVEPEPSDSPPMVESKSSAPVIEIRFVEDLEPDALWTEPPTAKLAVRTAPLPHAAVVFTAPLPPASPVDELEVELPAATAPLPETDEHADSETRSLGEVEPRRLELVVMDSSPPPQAVVEGGPVQGEPSVELALCVAAAGDDDPSGFQPVVAVRRLFPWELPDADTHGETAGEAEWVELEEVEESGPPPLAWLGVDDSEPVDFERHPERLVAALASLGQEPDSPGASADWELDLELFPELGPQGGVLALPAPTDPAALWQAPRVFEPRASDVDELVSGFSVSAARAPADLCRYLTEVAGLDRTPPPPPLVGRPILAVGGRAHRSESSELRLRTLRGIWSSLAEAPGERAREDSGSAERNAAARAS